MKIQSIEFKNFASYGNKIQKIEFREDRAELFLTLGKNGHGKTTIANAIVYALYGKVEGVKLGDIPNRINKDLWVRIKLTCKNTVVEIERGLLPNKFRVLLNGVEFDKAGKKSVQEYLEEEVFGIPYHVFKNIIILSVNDFKSFLTMSNYDKKQIIDRMFGFSVLNDMQQQVKEDRRELKTDLDSYDRELNQISESIVSVNMKLNQLLAEKTEKDSSKIQELKDTLTTLNEELKNLNKLKTEQTDILDSLNAEHNDKRSEASDIKREIDYLKKKLELYESGHCPTCETKLTSDWHLSQKSTFSEKISESTENIKTIKVQMDEIGEKLSTARFAKTDIESKITDHKFNMSKFKDELISLKDKDTSSDFDHLKQIITDFQKQEESKANLRDGVTEDYHFLETIEEVLGEDGVKNLAIKTILPGLNANIAAMTQTMHLPFHIRFDEKFNCLINHLGEEINPLTLSTGERKKADFIIIIAIIKILKLRFPQLNLLFLDELLSSVDADGVHNIIKILGQVIKESNINTFVINHSTLPHELFDKKIQIYRENGFSKFDIETIE